MSDWEEVNQEFPELFAFLESEMVKAGLCMVHCSHEGVCRLNREHLGPHDSGFCKWED